MWKSGYPWSHSVQVPGKWLLFRSIWKCYNKVLISLKSQCADISVVYRCIDFLVSFHSIPVPFQSHSCGFRSHSCGFLRIPADSGAIPVDSGGFLQEWEGHCKVLVIFSIPAYKIWLYRTVSWPELNKVMEILCIIIFSQISASNIHILGFIES